MTSTFLNEIYANAFKTIIALIVLLLAYMVIDFLAMRRMESPSQKRRFRIRSFYIVCVIFLFLMARIWVEGFMHLLAVLGLVSAALVVTNKETIMNVVGWFIIIWRDLFSEDDLIQIQQYKGYVKNIGVLYFTISEVNDGYKSSVTGRVIRIPNGLVTNNPLINYSQTSHLLEQELLVTITKNSDSTQAKQLLRTCVNNVLQAFYKDKREYTIDYIRQRNRRLADHINLTPVVIFKPKFDRPAGVQLTVRYYCFASDCEVIRQRIWRDLLPAIEAKTDIELAYDT